jgi:hypothetical protein
LHLLQLVAELVQALCDRRLAHHAVLADAAADPIGVALHISPEFGLLHFAESLAHLGRGFALPVLQIADGGLHALLELLQVLNLSFLLAGHLVGLLLCDTLAGLTKGPAHLSFECLLPACQIVGLLDEIVHLPGGLVVAHALRDLTGFLEPFGRASRLRLALGSAGLLRRSRAAHVLGGLGEAVEHLLKLLGIGSAYAAHVLLLLHGAVLRVLLLLAVLLLPVLRLAVLLLTILGLAALRLAILLLSGSTALLLLLAALLPRLARLRLTAGLALLAVAAQLLALSLALQLLHLLPKLFGLAAQLLLLPALLRGRLRVLLGLIRELLLSARERFQLLHRFIDLLLLRPGA